MLRLQGAKPTAAVAVLLAGGAMLVLYVLETLGLRLVPASAEPVWQWHHELIELCAATACVLRALSDRRERTAWLVMAAGIVSFTAADAYYVLVLSKMAAVPFPSAADAMYLAFYPAAYVALCLLLRVRGSRFSLSIWLDGLSVLLGLAAIGVAVFVPRVLADIGGDAATVFINAAYPLADMVLLALVSGIWLTTGRRPGRAWLLMTVGLAVFAVCDSIYLFQISAGTYTAGTILDAGWPAAILVVGVAAWQRPQTITANLDGWRELAVPLSAGGAGLVLLMFDHFVRSSAPAVALAALAIVAVVIRLGLTYAEHLQLVAAIRHDAVTDALTGLHNRRALITDVDRAASDASSRRPAMLALFDLDGFKAYNDTFGRRRGRHRPRLPHGR